MILFVFSEFYKIKFGFFLIVTLPRGLTYVGSFIYRHHNTFLVSESDHTYYSVDPNARQRNRHHVVLQSPRSVDCIHHGFNP